MSANMGQGNDVKSPEEPPASSKERPESAFLGDDDTNDAYLEITWPDRTFGPGEELGSKVQDLCDCGDEAEPKVDNDAATVAGVQIGVEADSSTDSNSAGETSTHTNRRHDPELFQEDCMKVQKAMGECAPDLYHLLRDKDPIYLRSGDFKLPANLCAHTSDLASKAGGFVGINAIDRAVLDPQPNDSDVVEKLKHLALTQGTLIEHVSRPLEMLRLYVDAWQLRVVDHESRSGAVLGLDPTVPTQEQAEMEAFLELTCQYNKLGREYAQLLVQVEAQRTEPSPSKNRPSWDWQQATRVCAACSRKFERQAKDKEKGEGMAHMQATDEEGQSMASFSIPSAPSSKNGEHASADDNMADDMAEMMEEWTDDGATFGDEQARLLQQPRYMSPTDSPSISVAEPQEEPETLEHTLRSSTTASLHRISNAYTNPRHTDAEAEFQSHSAPSDTPSVVSFLESYVLNQEDLPQSGGEQYMEGLFQQKCEEYDFLMNTYDEMAERYESMTKLYESSAKRYSNLTKRYENLMERHEEIKARLESERQIHDRVTAVYVTNAVEVAWTQGSSRSRSDESRSTSPPVSPKGTVSPMTASTSLNSAETGPWASIEPRVCDEASQRVQSTIEVDQYPLTAAPSRNEPHTKRLQTEISIPRERRSAPGIGQALTFPDFVENQCQSWIDIYNFLWSFILPIPQQAILIPGTDGSSPPLQVSRRINGNMELSVPWSAVFNVLTHIVLLFGIQTWIACARERNTWLHANNIKPRTLLSSYARGERSFWPGLHGGLFTSAEVNMLLLSILLNSRHVLELLGRVVRGLDLANQESMRVLVFGAAVFMFARIG